MKPWLLILPILFLTACAGFDLFGAPPETYYPPPAADDSPRGLMAKGQYQAAYAALQPRLKLGEPEAVFLALTIRRHGLDGQAPDPAQLRLLWEILTLRAEKMRRALRERDLDQGLKNAYRTALAQLAYFSGGASAWPPLPPADPEARDRAADEATRLLAPAMPDYPLALNFIAFLYLEPTFLNPGQAYAATLLAAERGDFLAMGNLAWLLRSGIGTEKNDLRAAHWAREGCNSAPPVPRNLNEMGYVYEKGLGVSADTKEAARWYEQAAARGQAAGAANARRLKQTAPAPVGSAVLDDLILF